MATQRAGLGCGLIVLGALGACTPEADKAHTWTMTVLQGDGQATTVDNTFDYAIRLQLFRPDGTPAASEHLILTAPQTEPTVWLQRYHTLDAFGDNEGRFVVPAPRAGSQPGPVAVEVSHATAGVLGQLNFRVVGTEPILMLDVAWSDQPPLVANISAQLFHADALPWANAIVRLSGTECTFSDATLTTDQDGNASTTCTPSATAMEIRVTATGAGVVRTATLALLAGEPARMDINVFPGPPAHLVTWGTWPQPPEVRVVDAVGRPVRVGTVGVTVEPGPGGARCVFGANALHTDISLAALTRYGTVAVPRCLADAATGPFQLRFELGTLSTTLAADVVAPVPAFLFASPPLAVLPPGSPVPWWCTATVKDAEGSALPGVAVRFSMSASGPLQCARPQGLNWPAQVTTDAYGEATVPPCELTFTTGELVVTADVPGFPGLNATCQLTVAGDPGVTLVPESGLDQVVPPGGVFAPLRLRAVDSSGRIAPPVVVTFTPPADEPTCAFETGAPSAAVTTNAAGLASSPLCFAGQQEGQFVMTVQVFDLAYGARFTVAVP